MKRIPFLPLSLLALTAAGLLTLPLPGCDGGGGDLGETACADGLDNDGDGLTDCHDEDCSTLDICQGCGNGIRDGAEACDGEDLGDATCQSLGHDAGTLRCDATCHYDESQCNDRPATPENLRRTDTH